MRYKALSIKTYALVRFAAGACAVAAMLGLGSLPVQAQDSHGEAESTVSDQTDVAVTVYNSNLALIRERRTLTLPRGIHELRFMDVPQLIQPETVSLHSLNAAGSLTVLEQNYEYDLISHEKLLEKYVGRNVSLRNFSTQLNMDFTVDAELLSTNGGPVYRVGEQIYLGHPGTVVLPEMPENLIAKPTLVWLLDNQQERQEIEATYLTHGMNWKADYVLTLDKAGTTMDVVGWVTLTNDSGAAYTNAQLKLVAGDVHRAPAKHMYMAAPAMEIAAGRQMAYDMTEESFAEYHLYSLPRRTTIKERQTKQVRLMGADGVAIGRIYEYRGNVAYYSQRMPNLGKEKVDVFIEFENEEANRMGMPLPAGIMRLYQQDNDGMFQFAGEDRIDHTPKDETVRLKMGQAFDVVAERVHTDFRAIGSNVYESAFEITVRNHKEDAITIDIVEPMPGDWEILQESHEHVKKDARTAVFSVPVPRDGEVKVTYRVRVRY